MAQLTYTIDIKDGGRVVIPAELRQSLGVQVGDRLIVRVTGEGRAELATPLVALAQVQQQFADLASEHSLSEALIIQRHEESQQE